MFTFDSIISTVQSYAKSPLAFVTNKAIRESLEQVVDAQADFAKVTTKATTDIFTAMTKEAQSFDFSKLYAVPAAK